MKLLYRFFLWAFLIGLASLVLFLVYEETGGMYGDVRWQNGSEAHGMLIVKVHDENGKPLPGIEVVTTSDSGTTNGTTGAEGSVNLMPGEDEVLALEVDGRKKMDKDNFIESWFAPTIDHGLTFDVTCRKK